MTIHNSNIQPSLTQEDASMNADSQGAIRLRLKHSKRNRLTSYKTSLRITMVAVVALIAPVLITRMTAASPESVMNGHTGHNVQSIVNEDLQPTLPLRAAFYYPWFPEAWQQGSTYPYTNYHPSLGYYDLSDPAVIQQHIAAMQYAHIAAGIASWWGPGDYTDRHFAALLAATAGSNFRWGLYYEREGTSNPTVSQLTADLTYLRDHYGQDPSVLRIGGRFVVFVYNANDTCEVVDRWAQANTTVQAYIVLKVFAGYSTCPQQPDGWHQYAPAVAADAQAGYSYSISPGFWKVGESPRLARDLTRWQANIRAMVASGAPFQLITTFNEWGEGTAVEGASEWASASGYGAYLDALHSNGLDPAATPVPLNSTAMPTSTPTRTPTRTPTATPTPNTSSGSGSTFAAEADANVKQSSPTTNFGLATTLLVDSGTGVNAEGYLRFTVSGVSGSIQNAKLRVYVDANGTVNGPAVYATGNTWTETGITWNNRPASTSGAMDDKGAISANSWVEYNVTPLVTGNGTYSFRLVTDSTDGVVFSSREGSFPPQLVVTTGTGATFTPTATPTRALTSTPTATPTRVPTSTPTTTPTGAPSGDAILIGAGDIASCSQNNDEATAKILDATSGTVFTAGDNAYESGTYTEYVNCYGPTWGRHKTRTEPSPGNHEYTTPGAAGYFQYWNNIPAYYAYDLGAWRIYSLNSEISMSSSSPQVVWLQNDLAAHPHACVLAYWHKPRWSSGTTHGSDTAMQALWNVLYAANADLIVNGHEHNFERFAPQNPSGQLDTTRGIREFVVGTGGRSLYNSFSPLPNSQIRNATSYGVIKLTLHATSYNWQFIPAAGSTFTDSGSGTCH